jgi:hypothetical protein
VKVDKEDDDPVEDEDPADYWRNRINTFIDHLPVVDE